MSFILAHVYTMFDIQFKLLELMDIRINKDNANISGSKIKQLE